MGNDFTSALKKLEKEKVRLSSQLLDIQTAIESLIKVGAALNLENDIVFHSDNSARKEKNLPYSDYNVVVPSRYDPDLTLPEMLIYALSVNSGMFAQDAAQYIYQIDPSVDIETLKKRFPDIASSLQRAKKITYKKIGKKYKYFIKESDMGYIIE